MPERTIEDRLRQEYFDLFPDLQTIAEQFESEVRYHCLPILRRLAKYERIVVTSRVKSCDSALDSLRRRQEGAVFDVATPGAYSLLRLRDLVGVRVLAFPRKRLAEIDDALRDIFPSWTPDPIKSDTDALVAYKYYGSNTTTKLNVQCEYQIVSLLTGLFWEVEHSAIYKPAPILKGIGRSLAMRQRTEEVYIALQAFEAEFEGVLAEGLRAEGESE